MRLFRAGSTFFRDRFGSSARCRLRALAAGAARSWAGWRWSRLAAYVTAALAGSVLLALCGLALAAAPAAPGSTETVIFEVPPGAGTVTIAAELERQGLIRDRIEFRLLATLLDWNSRLKAGRYDLSPGLSTWQILRKIGHGQVRTVAVTIPEGLTLAEILRVLASAGFGTEESLRQALVELDARGELPFLPQDRRRFIEPYEGILFPDTYFFAEQVSPQTVIRTMARRTEQVFSAELLARAGELGLTPFEVLTLASIIEKEARVAAERSLISSVYHNRLRISMKLDACPTVRYVLGKPGSERLLFADLEVDSPYNTYRNGGLPPGPICSPGLAAITAALYPAETRFYYFVSKNDGTHHFSRTLEEHLRAVRLYQGG
ncbi:MAG: endolytic transglycosylase MltG [Bacillota bacterium]